MNLKYPQEQFNLREAKGADFYKIMLVNTALNNYVYKKDFPWQLFIEVDLKDCTEPFKLPTDSEAKVLNKLEDKLTELIRLNSSYQFIGRITNNGHRELYFYVDDPKEIHKALQDFIKLNTSEREFEYKIAKDPEWKQVLFFYS